MSEERGGEGLARGRNETLHRAATVAAGALRASGATALLLRDGMDPDPLVHVGADDVDGRDADHPSRWRRVAERGGPVRIPPAEDGSRGAWLGVPIRAAATGVLGVLSVTGAPEGGWSEADAGLLARIAEGAAVELDLRAELDVSGAAARAQTEAVDRLAAFMEHSPVVAFMKDLEGTYLYRNAEFDRRFGPPRMPGGRTSTRDLLPPAAAERVGAADREVVARGTLQEYRERLPLPDGSERIWRILKFPFRPHHGPVLVGGLAIDVTEAEDAAYVLRERERQLNEAQALARVGSWEWDLVSGRGFWSDEHYRLFGHEPGSLEGTFAAVTARIHPADRDAFHVAVQEAYTGERPLDRVVRVVHTDGTTLHLHVRGELEVDLAGKPVRLFGTAQDVTELERVSQALRESEERYRRMVEAAGDIIYEADVEGRFTYANPATLRILGYETGEVIGRRYTALMRADYHAVAAEFYARQVRERLATTYFEFPAVTRGGSEVWLGQIVQLVWVDGRVAGWHAVARDISAQREVDRLKSEFVAVVSHELRTPLTSIRGSLGLLASGKAGVLTERGERLVEIAVQNAERLIRLINDILDIERLESGRVSLERRRVMAGALVEAALATVAGLSEAAAVAIEVTPPPVDAALCADPDRLVQVLTNLLANAVKFSPRGTQVRLRVRRMEDGTEFRVEDQGRGIPPDELESVFARFHQVDSSDSRDKGGTGLGLAISRSIVEHHGGRMWVESELGRGSVFTFTIPDDDAPCAESAGAAIPDSSS